MDKILNEGFASLGITPDAKAVERLKTYFEYLEEKTDSRSCETVS